MEEKSEEDSREGGDVQGDGTTSDYDAVLNSISTGRSHFKLLALCGWANASDAVELLAISFVITTPIECEFELTDSRKGWLTASLFIGMMLGGWMWGAFADIYGRRSTLIVSLLINSFCALLSAMANSYGLFLFLRMASGVGVGGSMPIIFTYFCEFLPPRNRGFYLSFLASSWMVGSLLTAGLAWLVLSHSECPRLENSTLAERCLSDTQYQCGDISAFGDRAAWRVFVVVASLPSLLAAIGMYLSPESPKWLHSTGQTAAAQAVLDNIRASSQQNTYQSLALRLTPLADAQASRLDFGDALKQVWTGTVALFEGSSKRPILVLGAVWFFLCFGYYGLTMWMPEYFSKGGVSNHVDIYEISFFNALSTLPGNILATLLVDHIGRKKTFFGSAALSCVSIFLVLALNATIFSCVFAGVSTAAWNVLDIMSAESFPTSKRAAASGFLAALGRLGAIFGNLSFGEFGSHPAPPIMIAGLAMACGALASLLVSDKTQHAIH